MLTRLRTHLTYANVVSSLCLFIVLGGGTAYAAKAIGSKQIANNSVQGKDIRNGTITGRDVKKASLTGGLFKKGQLPRGPIGATGPQGPAGQSGLAGAPATKLFASVGSTGNLMYGSGATAAKRNSTGDYTVTFNRALDGCVSIATPGLGVPATNGGNLPNDTTGARVSGDGPNELEVTIGKDGGQIEDSAFQLAVFC